MNDRFLAMLALSAPAAVTGEALAADLARRAPKLAPEITPFAPRSASAGNAVLLQVGGTMLTVMFIDTPLPGGTLDRAIQRAQRLWPEAAARLAAHRAHAVVGVLTKGEGFPATRAAAEHVTLAAAALSELLPTIGVYWCAAGKVIEAKQFRDYAAQIPAGQAPLDAWLQLNWLQGPPTAKGEPTCAIVTTGLQPFIGREIEFQPAAVPPQVMTERVIGTALYLLAQGPVLKDGEALGVSAAERIAIRHAPRGQRPDVPVLALTLERLDPATAG